MASIKKLADAIRNDVVSGLRGYHTNLSMSMEQLEEECVQYRLAILKEYMLKGIFPTQDLLTSINCIPVDCKDIDNCNCGRGLQCPEAYTEVAHFEIPQILFDFGLSKSIYYIGSTDRQNPFKVYTKPLNKIHTFQKYRKRGKQRPWVYIDVTPNEKGMLDCYIFDAPFIQSVSVVAIFKDPRQLEEFQCSCDGQNISDSQKDENMNFIDILIKERLTKQKLYYYRQMAAPLMPNDQRYAAG